MPEPSAGVLTGARVALDEASAHSRKRVIAIGRGHSRRTRRLAVSAVAVAAAVAALLVVPTMGEQPRATADAAQVLLRAGSAAGAQPGGWPDAAYWHSVSSYHQGSGADPPA